MLELHIKYSWVFIKFNLYEVTINHNNCVYTLRCSYKLLPFKLSMFYPELSNHKKLFFPYENLSRAELGGKCSEYANIDPLYHHLTLDDYLKIYCINDSMILKSGLIKKEFNGINLNLNKKYKVLIKNAYYGGRCEIFGNQKPDEKLLHFDFAGMYQMCMSEELPCGD